eukprot:COSAG06_NODE_562_length_14275_cov_28.599041_21_plen_57_part_00
MLCPQPLPPFPIISPLTRRRGDGMCVRCDRVIQKNTRHVQGNRGAGTLNRSRECGS